MTADGLDAFTGDAAGGEILRRSLRVMAEHYAGTPLGDQVGHVLAGRLGIRELAEDPEFAAFTQRGMHAWSEMWVSLSPDEREKLIERGLAAEAELGAVGVTER